MFSKEIIANISIIDSCIGFLRERRVLRTLPTICPTCNERAKEEKESGRGGKRAWRCRSNINFSKTIRHGSSHLKLDDFIMLTYLWAWKSAVKMVGGFLDLSKETIIVWFKLYRDICSKWMAANQPVNGGEGHVV